MRGDIKHLAKNFRDFEINDFIFKHDLGAEPGSDVYFLLLRCRNFFVFEMVWYIKLYKQFLLSWHVYLLLIKKRAF